MPENDPGWTIQVDDYDPVPLRVPLKAVDPDSTFGRRVYIDANHPSTGIKADGITDDAAAWQAFIDARSAGDHIIFTGKSILGSSIRWKSGVSLHGIGWGGSVLATKDTTGSSYFSAIEFTPAKGSASTTNVLEDCTFADFEIDGSGLSGTAFNIGGKGIYAQFMRRCQILNLYVHDTVASGIGTDYMPDCLIHGCVVKNCGRNWTSGGGGAGIGIGMGAWQDENVTISDCHAIDCGHYGIFVEWQIGQPYRSRGAKVVNCTSRGARGHGFADRGCGGTIFSGCSSVGSVSHGFEISYDAQNGVIVGCTATGNTKDGLHFDIDVNEGNWRVEASKFSANGQRGIYFDGHNTTAKAISLVGNDVSENQGHGISVDTTSGAGGLLANFVIKDNRVWNNGKGGVNTHGIRVDADVSGLLLAGNRCYDNQTTKTQTVGIKFSDSSTYTITDGQITSNHLTGNGSAGMSVGSVVRTNVAIRNNHGFATEARGQSQINDTGSSVTVIHGLALTPTSVTVTPKDGNEALWVTTLGTGGFVVNRAGTTGARPFLWQAEV